MTDSLKEKKTILVVVAILIIATIAMGMMYDTYQKNNPSDLEYNTQPLTEAQEISKLQAMTCEEFEIRNSNGVDYLSSEVRDVAKDIRESCNVQDGKWGGGSTALICGPGTTLENGICHTDMIHPDERGSMEPEPDMDLPIVATPNQSGVTLDRTMYLPPGFVTYTDINEYQPVWTLHITNFEAYHNCVNLSVGELDYNWCQAYTQYIEDKLNIDK